MKISNRAWHLRFVRIFNKKYVPRNLCQHFWAVVGTFFWIGVIIYLIAGLMTGVYLIVTSFYIQIGLAVASAAVLSVIIFTGVKIRSWFNRRPAKSPKESKEPGLVRSYIKARKDRYCPLIEVVED